ncbi:MAG: sigma-70 family RNA polymerase sigma factor [Acidobacteria bacterium]|nr:sigma-70 family RNA polymerase sigma factor [Acidobacteriota bacterium]
MGQAAPGEVTRLLQQWAAGDRSALDRLTPLVYDELRRLAAHYLRRERPDHTLASTALVHEAWLRLSDQTGISWQDRAHFFGIAARLTRQILVDHARRRQTAKRDPGGTLLSLDEALDVPGRSPVDLVRLDDALEALARRDELQSRIVELRFFAGLSVEETSEVVGWSPATVKREWVVARAWLFRELSRQC